MIHLTVHNGILRLFNVIMYCDALSVGYSYYCATFDSVIIYSDTFDSGLHTAQAYYYSSDS